MDTQTERPLPHAATPQEWIILAKAALTAAIEELRAVGDDAHTHAVADYAEAILDQAPPHGPMSG